VTGAVPPAAAPGPTAVELRRDDGLGPDALAMIAESEAELAAIYRPEVRHAFSPAQLIDAGVVFLTAHLDGRVVGCGGMAPCPGTGGGYGELKRIFVTRAARGRRIAALIIARLEEEARARGLPLMRLETGDASPEAVRAYERLGYRRRGPFGNYAENGSSVFMEKALVPAAAGKGPA
jgi:putative acetyltransferase